MTFLDITVDHGINIPNIVATLPSIFIDCHFHRTECTLLPDILLAWTTRRVQLCNMELLNLQNHTHSSLVLSKVINVFVWFLFVVFCDIVFCQFMGSFYRLRSLSKNHVFISNTHLRSFDRIRKSNVTMVYELCNVLEGYTKDIHQPAMTS